MLNQEGNVVDRREMLRVKLKALAAEAVIIRREEQRMLRTRRGKRRTGGQINWLYEELRSHRRCTVSGWARLTHLAYGAVRGLPLERMEAPGSAELTDSQRKEILRMYRVYGAPKAAVPAWMLPRAAEKVVELV